MKTTISGNHSSGRPSLGGRETPPRPNPPVAKSSVEPLRASRFCGATALPLLVALWSLASTAPAQPNDFAGKRDLSGTAVDGRSFVERLYLTTDIGAAFLEDAKVQSSDPFIDGTKVRFRPGARLDLAFGYHITGWLAAEFNFGATVDSTKNAPGDEPDSWTFYQVPMMANVVFNIPTRSRFRPFLGGGVGGVHTQLEDYDSLFYDRTEEDFGWAWQGFAGCRYQVASKVDVGVVYRYMGTTERSFNSFDLKMEGVQTHSVSASISLRF